MNFIVFNHEATPFGIRMIWKGDPTGLSGTRRHTEDEPLVEFWDIGRMVAPTLDFVDKAGAQMVTSHYARTVNSLVGVGLDLYMSQPAWKLDVVAIIMVQRFIRAEVVRVASAQSARVISIARKGKPQ